LGRIRKGQFLSDIELTVKPSHYALKFTSEQVQAAAAHRSRAPFKTAWAHMDALRPERLIAQAQRDSFRFRALGDTEAGARAVDALAALVESALDEAPDYRASLADTLIMAQCHEMLRDHPVFSADYQVAWRDRFAERIDALDTSIHDLPLIDALWLAALKTGAGVLLENEPLFETGTALYRETIDQHVHPEGYIPRAVETSAAQGLQNQVLCVQALILIAEIARCAGVDLWSYRQRGVSVVTAALYPLYYYFYPEKWQWGEKEWKRDIGLQQEVIEPEVAQAIFREHGGFLEMLNHHDRSHKAVRLILDEIRPVYDLHGGGFTTLTHAIPPRRGLFG